MNSATRQAVLAEWVRQLTARGYESLRQRYFETLVDEVFECAGKRYDVTTEAVWDAGVEGDLRVFIEISDALEAPPRTILDADVIATPDGSIIQAGD
ncbi:MAG: hypothetical protein ACRDNE_01355 [Gaiellaceae bacterium]